MAKNKGTLFFCSECGFESVKWMGQCPGCRQWNTFTQAPAPIKTQQGISAQRSAAPPSSPRPLSGVDMSCLERFGSGINELDRVLGGGIVPGSLVLVGGDPGIGKSTLLLQMCRELAAAGKNVLYISGEESLQQIKIRAERIGEFEDSLRLLCETDLTRIEEVINSELPSVVIIDSIQTMYSSLYAQMPGSISQVRAATSVFLRLAKSLNITIFLVGHVTKEGAVAGPKVLEHMVDTVLYFEGDRHASYRVLRSVKNRFGSTNEIGVFEMRENGLVQVKNPSEFMLGGKPRGASGSVITCAMEGTRPILVEVQALVSRTNFGIPRRTSAGADANRVNLLIAVLEKRAHIQLSSCDAYINVAGGMRMNEPAMDLAIILAVVSSHNDIPVKEGVICFGEVGLSGEVRAVSQAGGRISEAKKLGFEKCILPKVCITEDMKRQGIELIGVSNIQEAISAAGA